MVVGLNLKVSNNVMIVTRGAMRAVCLMIRKGDVEDVGVVGLGCGVKELDGWIMV